VTDYAKALGARLRAIRQQQGLSLHGVEEKSNEKWKAVVVGSYERDRPLSEASTIPSGWYTDPRIFELERQTVFARSWHLACRSAQVAAPGQFVSLELAGEPLVIVRGQDAVIRGFFNVCRHHAAAVVTAEEGSASSLRCPSRRCRISQPSRSS